MHSNKAIEKMENCYCLPFAVSNEFVSLYHLCSNRYRRSHDRPQFYIKISEIFFIVAAVVAVIVVHIAVILNFAQVPF